MRRHAQLPEVKRCKQLDASEQPAFKGRFERIGRCAPPLLCTVQGAVGKENERLKNLSSVVSSMYFKSAQPS